MNSHENEMKCLKGEDKSQHVCLLREGSLKVSFQKVLIIKVGSAVSSRLLFSFLVTPPSFFFRTSSKDVQQRKKFPLRWNDLIYPQGQYRAESLISHLQKFFMCKKYRQCDLQPIYLDWSTKSQEIRMYVVRILNFAR